MTPIETNPAAQLAAAAQCANATAPDAGQSADVQGKTLAQILASCESSLPLSVQSAYAGMQLQQAQLCKQQAQKKMEDMQNIQERQSKITSLIAKFRQEKATSGAMSESTFNEMKALGLSTDPNALESGWFQIKPGPEMDALIAKMQKAWDNSKEGSTERKWLDDWLPSLRNSRAEGKDFTLNGQNKANLQAAMERCGGETRNSFFTALKAGSGENGIKIAPQNDQRWEFNLKSMTNFQEQVGTKTQSTMVSLQDFIGQYNSYLQGANAAIDRANQLLAKLASGQQ